VSRFALTAQARLDLFEIWNYVADDSIDAADRITERLHEAFQKLAEMPHMGHRREDLADSRHRFWSVFSYVIVYRPDTQPMQIVAILHGARDIQAFLAARK